MKNLYVVLVICLVLISNAVAGDKADFSGNWAYNNAKSRLGENGGFFIPIKMTVKQEENKMSVERTFQGEYEDFVVPVDFSMDGKECESVFMDSPRVTSATWSEEGKKTDHCHQYQIQHGR